MNRKSLATMIAAFAVAFMSPSHAADREAKNPAGMRGMQEMGMMHGEHGRMGGCPMMGGAMHGGGMGMGGGMLPQLPPGNEKLQLQMWGEMMQKMGEIASKDAAQVK